MINLKKMKNIFIVAIVLLSVSCKAQDVFPLYDSPIDAPYDSYFKDLDNDFNPFVGEWKWENGNTSWTIQLQKFEMIPSGSSSFSDVLVGEYQYIENNVELINELPFIPNTNDLSVHNLWGGVITTVLRGTPPCDECPSNIRFISLQMTDPNRSGLFGEIIFAHFVENGIEKIRMEVYNTYNENNADSNIPSELTIPEGTYTFLKQ